MKPYINQFINFDKMLTPVFIKIVFWIGVVISLLFSLSMFFIGLMDGGGFLVFVSLIFLVVFPAMVRIYCELLIIIFKMHESLTDIKQQLKHSSSIE